MKNPPTLADCAVATMLDKSLPWTRRWAPAIKKVVLARKIVLDNSMSEYLADLSFSLWKGGLRKRLHQIENVRQLARLPHALTWVEFNQRLYIDRHRKTWNRPMGFPDGKVYAPDEPLDIGRVPERVGWLLEQHAQVDTAFRMTEFRDSNMKDDRVFINPPGLAWSADDGPIPWPRFRVFNDEEFEESEILAHMQGYKSDRVIFVEAFEDAPGALAAAHDVAGNGMLITSARDVWVLFATINDLPVKIEHVEPSRGYVAKGSYKTFLKHSVIHLNVPQTLWRKLTTKTAAAIKRRAHQVRGHWRKDYRHPLSPKCEHIWAPSGKHLVCQRCHGHQLYVSEHQRGDASMGFVTHDYEVSHEQNT